MRAPKRKRPSFRRILEEVDAVSRERIANRVNYVGSPEHKAIPTFAGHPRPRADATICDNSFRDRLEEIRVWLREAAIKGCMGGPWEGDFPRYLWYKVGDTVFEARLVNRENGDYKGYALERHEWPESIGIYYE